jgi:hypothetical protein
MMSNSLSRDFLLSLGCPEPPPLGKRCDDAENANNDEIRGTISIRMPKISEIIAVSNGTSNTIDFISLREDRDRTVSPLQCLWLL